MNEQVVSNNWGIWKTDFAGINSEAHASFRERGPLQVMGNRTTPQAPGERALKGRRCAIYLYWSCHQSYRRCRSAMADCRLLTGRDYPGAGLPSTCHWGDYPGCRDCPVVKSGRCRPFEFPGPSESPKILILVGLPCTAPVSRALHLLRERNAGLHWDALFLWQGCTFLRMLYVSKRVIFRGKNSLVWSWQAGRRWCYNPSIWQRTTASRDHRDVNRGSAMVNYCLELCTPPAANHSETFGRECGLRDCAQFSSIIARSHGASVNCADFAAAFPSSRFVPAP